MANVAVVGGGYAGVLTARRLARLAGARVEVTLVSEREDFVERIRLHEVAAGRETVRRSLTSLLRGTGVKFRRARVTQLDPQRRQLVLDGEETMSADFMVLAAGSTTQVSVPGVAQHAHRLDDAVSAARLRQALDATDGPLVVVGGGLTAIEAMTELQPVGGVRRAMLVCRGLLGEGALGPAAVAHVRRALEARSVEVRERASVASVEPAAIVIDGVTLPASVVVWTAGFVAAPLARSAGLPVDAVGRLIVDETLRVPGAPWLFGAGDAVTPNVAVGAPLHMSCKNALPMAVSVASSIEAVLAERAPAAFRFGDSGVCVSLGRRDGVIQLRSAAGENGAVITGRLAAWLKERVCRFTVDALGSVMLQRTFSIYAARGERVVRRAPAALPSTSGLR